MKKALLALLFIILLASGLVLLALADNEGACEIIRTDAPAKVVNGTTLVPMRAIFEWLGAEVKYTSHDKHIEAIRKGISVNLWIGDRHFKIRQPDGSRTVGNLKVKPIVVEERTLVPLRFVSEAMNCKVEYDADNRTVQIKDGERCGLVMLP